jgi:3-oxoacyl-[acyl-carrier protein] reductase
MAFLLPAKRSAAAPVWEALMRITYAAVNATGASRMAETLFGRETALITGAGHGIGRAMALALAREGARLLLAEIDPARGESALAAVRDAGGAAEFLRIDLAERGAAERLVAEAIGRLGRVDMLVHSASPPRHEEDTLMRLSDATWHAMHEVNLRSGFVLGRDLARHMIDGGIRGRMLYLTSLHAGTPRNLPHYSTAKAGMLMLVKELARALGAHGIRVNALTPGAVAAGGFKPGAGLAQKIPLGRLAEADDIAAMGVAVLSERYGRYVTGADIVVDGGMALYNWFDAAAP